MHISYIAGLALLAQSTLASLSIEDICSYTLPSGKETGATICLRGDQPLVFAKEISGTAKLGATGIQLCCPKGGICLLSSEAEPEVLCYDPTDKKASSHSNVSNCDLKDGKCGGINGSWVLSTEGVQTVTSVVNGKGITGKSSGTSTSKTSGATTLAVSGDMCGLLKVAFMAVIGGALVL